MVPYSLTSTKIMGIINANDDSFYTKSRFTGKDAISKITSMIDDGAHIIDIGGVSTKPGSLEIPESEELTRIKSICDIIKKEKLFKKVAFSIDSYTPKVIEYALQSGFTIVNDITGLQNDEVAKLTAKYNAKIIIMHMQGKPQTMQKNPHYADVVSEVHQFFEERIEKAKRFGIQNIILDVGIGFGKTLEHNLILLKNMDSFLDLNCELLIAASRKSMIDKITPSQTQERLSGTLAIHLDSVRRGATLVRTHDVKEHHQALKVQEAIDSLS
ncbi:MAG: dihydropteroate synthase [Arcobacteraceae bacterium]